MPNREPLPHLLHINLSQNSISLSPCLSLFWSLHTGMPLSLTESGLCFIWAGKYQIKRRVLKEALNCGNRAAVVVKQMNMPCDQREREGEVEEGDRCMFKKSDFSTTAQWLRAAEITASQVQKSLIKGNLLIESKSKLYWGWWSDLTTALLANGRSGLSLHSGMFHRCSLFLMCVTELERDFLG